MFACVLITSLWLLNLGSCSDAYLDQRYNPIYGNAPYHSYYYQHSDTPQNPPDTPQDPVPSLPASLPDDLSDQTTTADPSAAPDEFEEVFLVIEETATEEPSLEEPEIAGVALVAPDLPETIDYKYSPQEIPYGELYKEEESDSQYSQQQEKPHLYCYDCHSGALGHWQNVLCPANGYIRGWAAQTQPCYGPCVSIVTRYPLGDVIRGCSANYWFPFEVPTNECLLYEKNIYCFCSDDNCNRRNMEYDRHHLVRRYWK